MKLTIPLAFTAASLIFAFGTVSHAPADTGSKEVSSPLDFKVSDIDGEPLDLSKYKGKVVLMVNVASECGYTPQYAGLQKLYEQYGKDGLVVLGVPSNDFGRQEPGSNEDIKKFCSTRYKVSFPMTSKMVIKGEDQVPLYSFLTKKESNPKFSGEIGWNFEKFLINRKGEVVNRFKSGVEPNSEQLISAIEKELKAE